MSIRLIVNGIELDNISEKAKEWFLDVVRRSEEGPFISETCDNNTDAIILREKDENQMELF